MTLPTSITTYSEFWTEVVQKDYADAFNRIDDLRLAFHCAMSLNHMADWVFHGNESYVKNSFTWTHNQKGTLPVTSEEEFGIALCEHHGDFAVIRALANSAKHFKLRKPSVQNFKRHDADAPSESANVIVQSVTFGTGGYGQGPYGGSDRVQIQGTPDRNFTVVATSVHDMWQGLATTHGWTL